MLEFVKGDNQGWTVREIEGNPNQGFLSCSNFDRDIEVKSIINRLNLSKHSLIFIFGIYNAQLIDNLKNQISDRSIIVVIQITDSQRSFVVEDKCVETAIQGDNIIFLGGMIDDIYSALLYMLKDSRFAYLSKNISIITHPITKRLYSTEMQSVIRMLFENINATISSFGNSTEDMLVGTNNFFDNWNLYTHGLQAEVFKDIYKNKTAIIVGAGPSLDSNIELLKEAKGKALIFAVDAALDGLLNHGIVPDMVSTLERLDVTLKFYKNIVHRDDIVFGGPNLISGKVIEKFDKRIFTGREGDGFYKMLAEYLGHENLDVGMNVAHVPIAMAEHFGCNKIVLVGLDLAYTDGKTHYSDVTETKMNEEVDHTYRSNVRMVEGQDGSMMETYEYFLYSKVWIEKRINKSKIEFYNASTGGAKIYGAKEILLSEYISKYLGEEMVKPLYEVYLEVEKSSEKRRPNNNVLSLLNDILIQLDDVYACVDDLKKKLDDIDADIQTKVYEYNDVILKRRDRDYFVNFLLQPVVNMYNYRLASFGINLSNEESLELKEFSISYYLMLIELINKIKETINMYISVVE